MLAVNFVKIFKSTVPVLVPALFFMAANPEEVYAVDKLLNAAGSTDLRNSGFSESGQPAALIKPFFGSVLVLENNKYFLTLENRIREAKEEIAVCMYLFKTSDYPGNLAGKIMRELIIAARRGVQVKVLLEKNDREKDRLNKYNERTAEKLKEAGIPVWFDNKKINTHSKLIIIDSKLVFLGSHNLTHTALKISNETSVMIESAELAKYFLKLIRNLEFEATRY